MALRPAGMSDEEDEDDYFDGFSFSNDDLKTRSSISNVYSTTSKTNNRDEENYNDDIHLQNSIIHACKIGEFDIVQEYIAQHDVNKFLWNGWTLLLYAASTTQPEMIELLLTHGADPSVHKDGFTPLMALCSFVGTVERSLKCLQLLIDANADPNVMNKHKETALMCACRMQDEKFVDEFIKYVDNIDVCDNDGRTALSHAVALNKPGIVKILLEHNADASLIDRYNLTAKNIADTKGFIEISALLASDKEEAPIFCEVSQMTSWKDLFPDLYPRDEKLLDHDISALLYGMGLERYGLAFRGMDLKTFLQLTEDDLHHFGIDISVHREQFVESIARFHYKKWHIDSIHIVKKSLPFTIYNSVTSLGTVKKQISVIASSFQYVKNNFVKAANENIYLEPAQKMSFEEELRKTRITLTSLKEEIILFKKLAQKIDREDGLGVPASFITTSKEDRSNWIAILSVAAIVGLFLGRKMCFPKTL